MTDREIDPTQTEGDAPTGNAAEEFLSAGQLLGERYQVRRMLGAGGMGEVWQAFDLKLRVEVALKALRADIFADQKRIEGLRCEVRAAREVVSPNVCRIFDLEEVAGHELVSMEYVDGSTLLDVLEDRGPLALKEAQDIASQLLAGLEAIHAAGLVHRDIKPENIMLTRTGRVVVMDFGIARGQEEGAGTVSGTPAYMSPEQGRGGSVDARSDLYAAGVVLAEMVSPEGVKDRDSRESLWEGVRRDPPRIADTPWAPVLQRAVARDPERRYDSAHTLTRALEEITLRVEGADDLNPYPGLASFTEDDCEYFFGREAEVEQMWRRLEGPARLLALVGPSGAGKTSFLRAGVIPHAGAGWGIVHCTPGDAALASLRRAVIPELAGDVEALEQLAAGDEAATVQAFARWRKRHDRALVIVDQFEELFTQNTDDDQRRVVSVLGRLVLEADVHVLLGMRDDFLSYCAAHESLRPIFESMTPLQAPVGAALRRAVVQPAVKCGYRFEDDRLVDEMLAVVEGERGALPLLAFAMARVWERRDRQEGLLTREAYGQVGGVEGALAQHAERTLEEIGTNRLPIVRELFRNLVTAERTRAVRGWDELLSVFDDREAAMEVLGALIDARLLTSYEVDDEDGNAHRRVEIVHESLLAAWPRLVRWQTQDAEGAQLRDELRQSARAWDEHDRPDDRLWTGTAYREYQLWQERYPGGLSEVEEAFSRAMTSLATRRRRRRRVATAAAGLGLVTVLAVVTTLWRRSVAETRRAEAGKLLALGIAEIDRYPTAALAYARASLELADTPEARRFAVEVLWRGPVARILSRDQITRQIGASVNDKVYFGWPALSRDGRWLALETIGGSVLVFPSNGGEARRVSSSAQGWLRVLGFDPGSDLLVIGAPGGSVRVLSLPDLHEVRRLEIGSDRKGGVQLGPGVLMAWARMSGHESGYPIRIWPLDGGEARVVRGAWTDPWSLDPTLRWITYGRGASMYVDRFEGPTPTSERLIGQAGDRIKRLEFLRESSVLSFDVSGEIRLWSLSDSSSRVLKAPSKEVPFSDPVDGLAGRLAVWAPNASLDLWDLRDPPDVGPLRLARPVSHQGLTAAFQPGGPWLAVSNESDVSFWPVTGPAMRTLRYHGNTNQATVSFSPDDRWLVSTIGEAGVRLWPLDPEGPASRVLLPAEACWQVRFHPDGDQLLVGTVGGGAFLAPIAGGPPRRLETGWEGAVMTGGTAIDPSGRHAAAAPYAMDPSIRDPELRALRLWELPSGEGRTFSLAHVTDASWWGFSVLEFLPDGSLLAGGPGSDRVVRLVLPSEDDGEVTAETLLSARDNALDLSADGRRAVVGGAGGGAFELRLIDLVTGSSRRIEAHGRDIWSGAIDATGRIIVTGDTEGVIRAGPATGEEPYLLLGGHSGVVWSVDISPGGKWIASVGDEGIRLWRTPDVTKPPLHTLPHAELMARLDAFTNLRAVRDETSSTGWTLEVGPFPGWETVPTW